MASGLAAGNSDSKVRFFRNGMLRRYSFDRVDVTAWNSSIVGVPSTSRMRDS